MAGGNHNQQPGPRRNPAKRAPLPRPRLPGSTERESPAQPPFSRRANQPASGNEQRGEHKPRRKKEPATIEELIAVLVRHAIKRDDGLNISQFDSKFAPRLRAIVPENLRAMEADIIRQYLVDVAHAIYVAIVVGQFANRPVLCGVRAAELAADLLERVLTQIQGRKDQRTTAIRAANMLVGLTLNAVRLLESTSLGSQPLFGFTDRYERAVITTFGLKTQSEATGTAPWVGQPGNPLDKRIAGAINTMSNVFGDYIGKHGETMDDAEYDEVLIEFDGFMERFSPYIEGGSSGANEKRRELATRDSDTETAPVEPLNIDELRTRPAGVEIKLNDGRTLFVSSNDARRIGEAADGEVDDTARRAREDLERRQSETAETKPTRDT